AVLVDEDGDAAKADIAHRAAVAVGVGELRARDVELLEVGEFQPSLVVARGADDGVAGGAQGLDVAVRQNLVDLVPGNGEVETGERPGAVGRRRRGGVAGGERAAAVL